MEKSNRKPLVYPIEYNLIKLKTLDTALVNQELKYPSGDTVAQGTLLNEDSYPRVGKAFFVNKSALSFVFRTSPINKIVEETDNYIIFDTWNSTYKIEYRDMV